MKYCWVTINKNHEVLVPEASKDNIKDLYSSKCQYKDNIVFADVFENLSLFEVVGPNHSITGNRIHGYYNAEIRCSAGGKLLNHKERFTSIEDAKKWVNKKITRESYKFYIKQSSAYEKLIHETNRNIYHLNKFYPIEF